MSGLRIACALSALLAIVGCALEAPVSAVPAEYDFGPPRPQARDLPAIAGVVLVSSVRAPAWLDADGIVYRLLYDGVQKPQAYAMSRWAAEPAALLAERVRSRLAAAAQGVISPAFGARSDYTLRLELEDFSQHFDAPAQSRVLLRARATLLDSERRTLLAQRVFTVEQAAEPNAAGAVEALTEATEIFLRDLLPWMAAHAKAPLRAQPH